MGSPSSPVLVEDGWQNSTFAGIAMNEQRRRQNFATVVAAMQGGDEVFVPPDNFPVLVSRAVIIPYQKVFEGHLIWSITASHRSIIERIYLPPNPWIWPHRSTPQP